MNEGHILKRLFVIQRLHFRILQEELEKHDIHPGQPPMLILIEKNNGITQNEIADKLNVRAATVAIMLRRMERAGLIQKRQDENDRRVQHVYLTEKGKNICGILKERAERIEQIAMQGFSESERQELVKLLDRVITNFKDHMKEWCHD
ncbi:MAG: MarR family winged helix-turn-helix transcriptional regulator [Pseudothermotoga sp.]|nr:MarR family transcriptional regulator [Pseudothermotoga sp.]